MANWGDHEYDLLFKANANLESAVSANYQPPVWGDHTWNLLDKLTSNIGNISISSGGAKLVIVANQAARLALTASQVNVGDLVQETDTGDNYIVLDTAELNNAAGWQQITPNAPFSFVAALEPQDSSPATVPNATYSALPFDTAQFGGTLIGSAFLVPSDGVYSLIGSVLMGFAAPGNCGLFVFVNNTRVADMEWKQVGVGQTNIDGSCLVELEAGDLVTLRVYQSTGEDAQLFATANSGATKLMFFQGVKL
jgi:hypothetical protein